MEQQPIKTYDEMNTEIINLLRISGSPADLYAAQRIEELEAENARLKQQLAYYQNAVKTLTEEDNDDEALE